MSSFSHKEVRESKCDICYSYSTGTGIHGSKLPESEGAARGQGMFTLLYIPGNRAITIIYRTSDWLQITNIVRMLADTIATKVTKLETTAGVNEMAETFTCSLTVLACTLRWAVLEMLTWQHMDHSSHLLTPYIALVTVSSHA